MILSVNWRLIWHTMNGHFRLGIPPCFKSVAIWRLLRYKSVDQINIPNLYNFVTSFPDNLKETISPQLSANPSMNQRLTWHPNWQAIRAWIEDSFFTKSDANSYVIGRLTGHSIGHEFVRESQTDFAPNRTNLSNLPKNLRPFYSHFVKKFKGILEIFREINVYFINAV